VDRLTQAAPVWVERTVYVSESWLPSPFRCPGCGREALWFPAEMTDTHVCVACGGVYSIRGLAPTEDHKTVAARIRQVTGWAGAGEDSAPSGQGAAGDAGR
jgi:hypothetical protein